MRVVSREELVKIEESSSCVIHGRKSMIWTLPNNQTIVAVKR